MFFWPEKWNYKYVRKINIFFPQNSNLLWWVFLEKLSKKSLFFDALGKKECFLDQKSEVLKKIHKIEIFKGG